MKRMICSVLVLFLIAGAAQAQSTKKKSTKKQSTAKSTKSTKSSNKSAASSNTVTLTSVSSNMAKANTSSPTRLSISDPILTSLDARANGANVSVGKSGIIGMPKRAYGFANGHILLTSTGATTSGTQTGSGSVGTGTSLGTFGSVGPSILVNGKSPYAGINMWGNAYNLNFRRTDSTGRSGTSKNQ